MYLLAVLLWWLPGLSLLWCLYWRRLLTGWLRHLLRRLRRLQW